jgi:hypothetical protein
MIGGDGDGTQKAISAALPALMGGLAKNASKPEGRDALLSALDRHDGSNLQQGVSGVDTTDGAKILGHVFGARQTGVEQEISKQSGLDLGSVAKLLPVLAPMVMGMLGQKKSQGGLDAGSLAGMLGSERDGAAKSNPGLGGLLGMLDSDGDGFDLDDVTKLAGKGGKGGLGGLLGKLLGR